MWCSPAALVPAAVRDLPSIGIVVHFVDVLQHLSLDRLGPKLPKVNWGQTRLQRKDGPGAREPCRAGRACAPVDLCLRVSVQIRSHLSSVFRFVTFFKDYFMGILLDVLIGGPLFYAPFYQADPFRVKWLISSSQWAQEWFIRVKTVCLTRQVLSVHIWHA